MFVVVTVVNTETSYYTVRPMSNYIVEGSVDK